MKTLRTLIFVLPMLLLSSPRAAAQYYGVGSNIALLATGTINLSFEAAVAPRWSVNIPVYWNPVKTDKLQMRLFGLQPGVRYWFFEEYAGHFIGSHAAAAWYDLGNARFQRKGWLAGVGISYGYAWLLSRRWNFTLEAGVGLYYMRDDKRSHYTPPFDKEYIYSSRRLAFGPSRCEIGFSYLF